VIIPDVSNNHIIVKETNTAGIPVLGLVNSNSNIEIAYPIFANDCSKTSVFFFCHFLSSLILKELVKTKHKIYTPTKKKKNYQFQQAMQSIKHFNRKNLRQKLYQQKHEIRKRYSFKGQYFLNHFLKPRKIQKKNVRFA
jgi:ribosomal protein S2